MRYLNAFCCKYTRHSYVYLQTSEKKPARMIVNGQWGWHLLILRNPQSVCEISTTECHSEYCNTPYNKQKKPCTCRMDYIKEMVRRPGQNVQRVNHKK